MKVLLTLAIAFLAALQGWSQQNIIFDNPSFEDMPQFGRPPLGWVGCGFESESPVDIQPGSWQVTQKACHGATYLGMVVRASGTWEGVSQKISSPLQPGVLYTLDAFLARSPVYLSPVSFYSIEDSTNFDHPVILRLWGGKAPCTYLQLLAQTPPVEHEDWKAYRLSFIPIEPWTHVTLEAFFDLGAGRLYYGNILVDNLSNIEPHELREADDETLEWTMSQIPPNLLFGNSEGVPAAALVIMLSNIEQALHEAGFAEFWGQMKREDILMGIQNLRSAGAGAHAALLEQWAEILRTSDDSNHKRPEQLQDLENLWNAVEQHTPLSSIRRKLVLKYREDILYWIETRLKR